MVKFTHLMSTTMNADALKAKTRDKDEQVLAESVSRQLPLKMADEKAEELNYRMKCRKTLLIEKSKSWILS